MKGAFSGLSVFAIFLTSGLRVKHVDRNTGDVVGRLRNGPCLYFRHQETATDDHFRERQSAHPNLPEFAGSSSITDSKSGPANVTNRLRRNGFDLHCERK